jgi:hypothetical protein
LIEINVRFFQRERKKDEILMTATDVSRKRTEPKKKKKKHL